MPRPEIQAQGVWLYDTITLQIYPITNCSPDEDALKKIKVYLDLHQICRADRVQIIVNPEVPWATRSIWTHQALFNYEQFRMPGRVAIVNTRSPTFFIAYFDTGAFVGPDGLGDLFGVYYNVASIAIWKRQAVGAEAETLFHELCHAFGLVGSLRDPLHPYHCPHEDCVMYWFMRRLNTSLTKTCLLKLEQRLQAVR